MSRLKNFKGKQNTNGFRENPQNIGNKTPSLKTQLNAVLESDGVIVFDAKEVTIEGDKVKVKVPKGSELLMKLFRIATGDTAKSLEAIRFIMEWKEGKAAQPLAHTIDSNNIQIGYGSDPMLLEN